MGEREALGGAVNCQVQIINWDHLPFCALIYKDNFRIADLKNATWFASLTVNLTMPRPPIDPLVGFAQVG